MIRFATNNDLLDCLKMGVDFCGMAGMKPSRIKIKQTLKDLINNQSLIVYGDKPQGMIAGIIYEHYFNTEVISQELFWWVDPESRGGVGLKLLSAFENWSKDNGAEKIMMISLEANDVSKVYKKRGYAPLEHTFVRSI